MQGIYHLAAYSEVSVTPAFWAMALKNLVGIIVNSYSLENPLSH